MADEEAAERRITGQPPQEIVGYGRDRVLAAQPLIERRVRRSAHGRLQDQAEHQGDQDSLHGMLPHRRAAVVGRQIARPICSALTATNGRAPRLDAGAAAAG
jgi:hypothetical protein